MLVWVLSISFHLTISLLCYCYVYIPHIAAAFYRFLHLCVCVCVCMWMCTLCTQNIKKNNFLFILHILCTRKGISVCPVTSIPLYWSPFSLIRLWCSVARSCSPILYIQFCVHIVSDWMTVRECVCMLRMLLLFCTFQIRLHRLSFACSVCFGFSFLASSEIVHALEA